MRRSLMNPTDAVLEIYHLALKIDEPFSSLSDDDKTRIQELMESFEVLESEHGTLPHGDLIRLMLLSKGGRYDEALALADQHYQATPSWETATRLANAARRAGDLERAVAMFAKGTEHDPKDLACWLEIGDIRLEQERFADALVAYEKALAKDEKHQWALPSAFYCRHALGFPGNWLLSLREWANQEGCTCGLEGCLTSVFGTYGSAAGITRANDLLSKVDRTAERQ